MSDMSISTNFSPSQPLNQPNVKGPDQKETVIDSWEKSTVETKKESVTFSSIFKKMGNAFAKTKNSEAGRLLTGVAIGAAGGAATGALGMLPCVLAVASVAGGGIGACISAFCALPVGLAVAGLATLGAGLGAVESLHRMAANKK